MVIAGILISAKVVIDNYSSFSGSSALTKKVQTFFLQIVRNVAERWQYLDPEQNLEIKLGKLVLRMDARGPYGNETVSWTVVSDYGRANGGVGSRRVSRVFRRGFSVFCSTGRSMENGCALDGSPFLQRGASGEANCWLNPKLKLYLEAIPHKIYIDLLMLRSPVQSYSGSGG